MFLQLLGALSSIPQGLDEVSARCENVQLLRHDAKQIMFYFREDLQSCISSSQLCSDVCKWEAWAFTKSRARTQNHQLLKYLCEFSNLHQASHYSQFSSYFYEKLIKPSAWKLWMHSDFPLFFQNVIPVHKINYSCYRIRTKIYDCSCTMSLALSFPYQSLHVVCFLWRFSFLSYFFLHCWNENFKLSVK